MTTINLRELYPWYTEDAFIEVSDRNFSYRFGKMQGVNRSSSKKGDTAASIGSVATLPKKHLSVLCLLG